MEKLFFAPFELVLNQILSRDPNFQIFLDTHKSKVMKINFIYIYILDNGLRFGLDLNKHGEAKHIPNLSVNFPLSQSFLVLIETLQDKLDYKRLDVHGDLDLAQDFFSLLKNYDGFYLNQISKIFGDVFAYGTECVNKSIKKTCDYKVANLKETLKMYLEDELLVVATKEEVVNFNLRVDALRLAVDRLEAKIVALQNANH